MNFFVNHFKTLHARKNLLLACLLFLISSTLVQLLAKLAALEFGGDVLTLSSACKWDCAWYAGLLQFGYHLEPAFHPDHDAANWVFFPLFPLLAKLIGSGFRLSAELALLLSSKILILPAIYLFMLFTEMILGPGLAGVAGVAFAFSPYIIYAHAGYTETLYFLLTTLAFVLLHKRAWIFAGLVGGMLSATRLVGFVFLSSFALYFRQAKRAPMQNQLDYCLGLLLCPLGLVLFMSYMYFHSGDALAFSHLQRAWGRSLSNPLIVLLNGLSGGEWYLYYTAVVFFGLGIVAWLSYRRYFDQAIFLFLAIVIPLFTGLPSIPRYVFWQMPFLFGVVDLIGRRQTLFAIYACLSSALSVFIVLSWFVGMKPYVI